MSDASEKLNYDTDLAEDERLALAAANAIQRLIAERNALRDQAADQKRELLRVYRQVALIRDSYRRLTLEFVTQLQHIDSVVAGVFPDSNGPAGTTYSGDKSAEDPSLVQG
jgi:hypothetical protein